MMPALFLKLQQYELFWELFPRYSSWETLYQPGKERILPDRDMLTVKGKHMELWQQK
jgi:hypothetical protein